MKRRSDDIAKVLGMASEWKPLEALGPCYGESWFVSRPGEGAFLQVLNRTPEEAAKARRRPMPPNLKTYAAARTRDEIDDDTVVEWSMFRIPDINRGDCIDAMIADHKIAKHTANALLLYPLLDSHWPRWSTTQATTQATGGSQRPPARSLAATGRRRGLSHANTFIVIVYQRMRGATAQRLICVVSIVSAEAMGQVNVSARTKSTSSEPKGGRSAVLLPSPHPVPDQAHRQYGRVLPDAGNVSQGGHAADG
jgi:hypothetical protein